MTAESSEPGPSETRWWAWPAFWSFFCRLIIWPICAMAVVFLASALHQATIPPRDWSEIVGAPLYFAFAWFMGRGLITGIGLSGDVIFTRRMLPGWVERIPLARVRSAQLSEDLFNLRLVIWGPGLLPTVLHHTRLAGGLQVAHWDELIAALRARLEPLGKWKEGERGAWS